MEKENLRGLFEAIKSDNEKLFTSFMLSKSDLNISFGRFPILSLCYLYGAEKILFKYERYLEPINKFEIVPEYFEIYKTFKRKAKRALRLYADKTQIVYPIEMLAILDQRKFIANKYKFLFKNEDILNNLKKIYNLNQKIEITATRENFEVEQKNLKLSQKIIASILSFVFVVFASFSFISIIISGNVFGKGTKNSPIKISNEAEFITALLKGDKYYVLESDLTISKQVTVDRFSGTIDGKEFNVYMTANSSESLIKNLTGTIQNINFNYQINNEKIDKNYAFLAENNAGNIKNCSFFGEINTTINSDKDTFISGVVVENSGTIDTIDVALSANVSNAGQTNAYLSGIAGVNKAGGLISNANTLSGKFETDTVDLAGIAVENYGTILNSSNAIELVQISNKEWHPNCAGISMQNYALIDGCKNYAKISSKSTRETAEEEQEFHVYAGGIVCNNYKSILNSKNYGEIVGEGDVSLVFAGGIAALNVLDETYSYEIKIQNGREVKFVVCEIEKSKSTGKIYARSEKSSVYVGGVSAVNNAQITYCGFEGEIDANTNSTKENEVIVFAGGVVGANNHTPLQNCYADVEFKNKPAEVEKIIKTYGAVAGFIGNSRVYNEFLGQNGYSEGYNYIASNYYVVDESSPYSAYGRLTTVHDFFGTEITYSFEKIANDETYFIKVESIDNIPGGIRIYG